MPRLRFHAVDLNQVKSASSSLAASLAEILGIDSAHFFLECIASTHVHNGEEVESFPLVEVHCFDRGEIAFDRMAKAITAEMLAAGCPSVDVVFSVQNRRFYYEDGEHL